MSSSIPAPGTNTIPDNAIAPEQILRDAANAEFTLLVARWLLDHWDYIPPLHRSALSYALDYGGEFGEDKTMIFHVQLRGLLETITVLRKRGIVGR